MGLAKYALVFGLGYAAGHPAGREKLRTVPGQVNELAHRPEAEQLKEKGKALAGQAVQTAKQRLGKTTTGDAGTGGPDADTTNGRRGWRPLGRRSQPTVVEETVVVTETTGATGRAGGTDVGTSAVVDKDAADRDPAMHGTLPPTSGTGRPAPGSTPR